MEFFFWTIVLAAQPTGDNMNFLDDFKHMNKQDWLEALGFTLFVLVAIPFFFALAEVVAP